MNILDLLNAQWANKKLVRVTYDCGQTTFIGYVRKFFFENKSVSLYMEFQDYETGVIYNLNVKFDSIEPYYPIFNNSKDILSQLKEFDREGDSLHLYYNDKRKTFRRIKVILLLNGSGKAKDFLQNQGFTFVDNKGKGAYSYYEKKFPIDEE